MKKGKTTIFGPDVPKWQQKLLTWMDDTLSSAKNILKWTFGFGAVCAIGAGLVGLAVGGITAMAAAIPAAAAVGCQLGGLIGLGIYAKSAIRSYFSINNGTNLNLNAKASGDTAGAKTIDLGLPIIKAFGLPVVWQGIPLNGGVLRATQSQPDGPISLRLLDRSVTR
ncbi:MAG: hypothetical protein EYC62_07495 [Alphaproteobacteria bacterium]|nr:MAG: hypothetical protein EYC62_07495 [Alphaproteobacteria bacterium]